MRIVAGTLTMRQSLMEGSEAAEGGAIHATSASVVVNASTVRGCRASGDGGGLLAMEGSHVLVGEGSAVEENIASRSGGALHAVSSAVWMQDGVIVRDNTAQLGGGDVERVGEERDESLHARHPRLVHTLARSRPLIHTQRAGA